MDDYLYKKCAISLQRDVRYNSFLGRDKSMKKGEYGYHSIWSNLPRFIRKSAEKRTKVQKEITK